MSDIAERLVEIGLRGHIAELEAEIERLQAGLDKAHRLLNQSIQWQRDAEITKAKQAAEIERLRAARETQAKEIDRLCAMALEDKTEIERLRGENKQLSDHWDDIAHERNDLRAALRKLLVECGEGAAEGRAIDLLSKKTIENAHAALAKSRPRQG